MANTVPWLVLTVASLNPYIIEDQYKVILSKLQDGDEANEMASIIQDVCNEVRTAIASNPRNALSGTAFSIPPEVKRITCYLIIEGFSGIFSTATPMTPAQMDLVKWAKEQLEKIRDWSKPGNQFLISKPSDPETEPKQVYEPPAAIVGGSERLRTRETLEGL